MNINTVAATKVAEEVTTIAQRGILSAEVVLTGFVVVFAVLIMLIVLIMVYGTIINKAEKTAKLRKEKAEKKAEAPQPKIQAPVAVNPVNQTNGISDEVVAVISAAVATMYGSTEKVKIKSIKKANNGRSAWANAGVLNNTRPF